MNKDNMNSYFNYVPNRNNTNMAVFCTDQVSFPIFDSFKQMEQFVVDIKNALIDSNEKGFNSVGNISRLIEMLKMYKLPFACLIRENLHDELIQCYLLENAQDKVIELFTSIVDIFNYNDCEDCNYSARDYVNNLKKFSIELNKTQPCRLKATNVETLFAKIASLEYEMDIIYSIEDFGDAEKKQYMNRFLRELNDISNKHKEFQQDKIFPFDKITNEFFIASISKIQSMLNHYSNANNNNTVPNMSYNINNNNKNIPNYNSNNNNNSNSNTIFNSNIVDINSNDGGIISSDYYINNTYNVNQLFNQQNIESINNNNNNNTFNYNNYNINTNTNNIVVNIDKVEQYVSKTELKKRHFLYLNEIIPEEESIEIEYKHYSYPLTPTTLEELSRQICGFLNAKGGRIYIGINDKKQVKGLLLNSKSKDNLRNELVNITYEFYPKCRTQKMNVHFIPVKDYKYDKYYKNMYVVKLIIKQGDTNRLYSVSNKKGYISHLRMPGQCANLTAEEIEEEIIKRKNNPHIQRDLTEFDDVEPVQPSNKEDFVMSESLNKEMYLKKNANFNIRDNYIKEGKKGKGIGGKYITVKVSNICNNINVKELENIFSVCKVVSMKFFKEGNKNKGYGFLNFETIADGKEAIERFNGKQLGTKQLKLKLV